MKTENEKDLLYYICVLSLWIVIFFLIIGLMGKLVNAYTVNKARPLTQYNKNFFIPNQILLNQSTINYLLNLKPKNGAWAYQQGYADAIADINDYLKIKKKTSNYFYSPEINKDLTVCFPLKDYNITHRLFTVNMSLYQLIIILI